MAETDMNGQRQEIIGFLKSTKAFQQLDARDLDYVARHSIKKLFDRGDVIFTDGDEVECVWLIVRGRVHIFRQTVKGRRMAIEVLGRGDMFGIRWDWKAQVPHHDTSAVAKEPTVSICIPQRVFFQHCLNIAAFAREMCGLFGQKLKAAYDQRALGQEGMPVRLAATLISLHHGFGEIVPLTKKELSEVVDATQETTFRTISRLQRSGYIQSLRGGIRIVDRKGLQSVIGR